MISRHRNKGWVSSWFGVRPGRSDTGGQTETVRPSGHAGLVSDRDGQTCGGQTETVRPGGQGNAKAIYVSLEVVLNFPPPQAITTNCFPLISYVAGVANAAAGSLYCHNNFPLRLLNARK